MNAGLNFNSGYLLILGKLVKCALKSDTSCIMNDLTHLEIHDISLPATRRPVSSVLAFRSSILAPGCSIIALTLTLTFA